MIKIPPPLLVLILVISNYFSSKKIDLILLPNQNLISFIILLIGVLILINPILKFRKSKTTIDPIKFKKVNKLVTSGIYKYSRNPMYLGLLMIVISTSIFYLNIFSMITPILFYYWINRFQIKREEIFLSEKFGKEYLFYKKNKIKSNVILLDDSKMNKWVPRVSEKWDGGIPATLIVNSSNYNFYPNPFEKEELVGEILKAID